MRSRISATTLVVLVACLEIDDRQTSVAPFSAAGSSMSAGGAAGNAQVAGSANAGASGGVAGNGGMPASSSGSAGTSGGGAGTGGGGGSESGGSDGGGSAGTEPAGGAPGSAGAAGSGPIGPCPEYCDTFSANCPTLYATDYSDQDGCVTQCEAFTPGADGEYSGNTAACRLVHAQNAAGDPDGVHCDHARLEPTAVCVD